jgi:hypothetical protein
VFGGSVGSGLPQNSMDLSAERADSDFDCRHRLAVSAVYDLPFGKLWAHGSPWRKVVLDHWQMAGILTAQSGSPFTVNLAVSSGGSAAAAFGNPARPDVISNPNKAGPVMSSPYPQCQTTISQGGWAADVVGQPGSWFNTCAFVQNVVQAPTGQEFPLFGDAGRNILVGPALANLDFSLSKTFPLHSERQRLQIRGEFFNLTNHPNFDIPDHAFTPGPPSETGTGVVGSANAYGNKPPRQIQLGLKYSF